MVRIKGGIVTKRRHKKILKQASGYRMTRRKQIKKAYEAVLHAGEYAYHGRKLKKRDFRKLWIIRINAAVRRTAGLTYTRFIRLLKEKRIDLDRKILSRLAVEQPRIFAKIVEQVREDGQR